MGRQPAAASALIIGTIMLVVGLFTAAHSRPPRAQNPPVRAAAKFQVQGSASCASAACHRGNGPMAAAGSEYTTWSLHDPHANAWRVLLDERSQQITAKLRATVSADRNPECLNCHVQPHVDTMSHRPRFSTKDGVSCEACHGPAERWLNEHHRPDWKLRKLQDRQALGWCDTKDLRTRAELCASCHVGRPGMEVSHDLIAAGHPPLRFEFAAYQANLPKHWQEKGANSRADFSARTWIIGQLVTAQASVDCLEQRANRGSTWPELADFDCFACHHDLQAATWRQRSRKLLGAPSFNKWPLAILDDVRELDLADADISLESCQTLERAMSKFTPDRNQVKSAANTLAQELTKTLEKLERASIADEHIEHLERWLIKKWDTASSWEECVQIYLGVAALSVGRETAERSVRLKSMTDRLGFAAGYNSPRAFVPNRVPEED